MTTPNKPSREALEMIAHFARHGIALEREQQEAVVTICRQARTIRRTMEASCNGHPAAVYRNVTSDEQAEWWAQVEKRGDHAGQRIYNAVKLIPAIQEALIGGDPRGATVKLIMVPEWRRLHDSFGGDAYCVPGS